MMMVTDDSTFITRNMAVLDVSWSTFAMAAPLGPAEPDLSTAGRCSRARGRGGRVRACPSAAAAAAAASRGLPAGAEADRAGSRPVRAASTRLGRRAPGEAPF